VQAWWLKVNFDEDLLDPVTTGWYIYIEYTSNQRWSEVKVRGRTQTTWPLVGRGGQAKHHVKPRGGRGESSWKPRDIFPPIFAFLFPTKQWNCHLLRALNHTERKNVGIVTIFNREGGFSDHSDKESWRLRCVSETLRLVATNAIRVIVPCPISYRKNLYRNERYSIATVTIVNRRRYDLYCAPRWSKAFPHSAFDSQPASAIAGATSGGTDRVILSVVIKWVKC